MVRHSGLASPDMQVQGQEQGQEHGQDANDANFGVKVESSGQSSDWPAA
jgi:hypothetical protein